MLAVPLKWKLHFKTPKKDILLNEQTFSIYLNDGDDKRDSDKNNCVIFNPLHHFIIATLEGKMIPVA